MKPPKIFIWFKVDVYIEVNKPLEELPYLVALQHREKKAIYIVPQISAILVVVPQYGVDSFRYLAGTAYLFS